MSGAESAEAFVGMLSPTHRLQEGEMSKKLQDQCFRIVSVKSPAKLYCCYAVIAVLTVAVIVLSVALSLSGRSPEQTSTKSTYCPTKWIGFGDRCFYFSENTNNWTFSQTFCKVQEAQLAKFDSLEELNFLKRYKGTFDHWIGLHRESPEHPWMWTDNTEYNSSVSEAIRGMEKYAYLNNNGISSARVHADRRWICSKPSNYVLKCQIPFSSF
ncbi:C-type lectin domain family 2 member D11 [Phodopus roborovskii]|uniref:LOC101830303 protein n=1 Tax=Phodopus roborovskii TaxID=109678 RepID=A0AAV0ABP8_PHORO|nr:C-type lectin domain family 2 member D11 [Phodopus roborovskii]CAH7423273.1 LOC101830303 [Phodopus roborovskii]